MTQRMTAANIKAEPMAPPMPAFTSISGCHHAMTENTPARAAAAIRNVRMLDYRTGSV